MGNSSCKIKKHKVVLSLMPFWTPLIPPQALAQLKGFIKEHSEHQVKTIDYNVMVEFREFYNKYFSTLRSFVPEEKCGNFYNVGHDALQNHMMAYFNNTNHDEYVDLIKMVIYQNYFIHVNDMQIKQLDDILKDVYEKIEEKIDETIQNENPDIMGFTAYNHTLPAVVYACKYIKKNHPNIKTLLGGGVFIWQLTPHNPDYEYFLEYTKDCIDKIFIGRGQFLILKYLNDELDINQRVYTEQDIEERLTYHNFVLPDMEDFDVEYYPYLAISGSTSCPHRCSFCSINKYFGEYTKKDPVMAVNEIQSLKEKYNRQVFFMIDSLINPVVDDVSKELLKTGVNVYFDGYFRVDEPSADINNTLLWRKAGFYRARIGVETGSQRVLDMMGKSITIDMTRGSLKALSEAGIKTTTFWVIGHPGETEEDFQMTLDFLEEMKDYIYEAEYNPFFYYYSNQANTDEWSDGAELLFPAKYRDMLITQTWYLNDNPTRKEMFERVNRFEEKRRQLGIPNPYTLKEIYQADMRWKQLHKNAAPAMVDLQNETIHIEKTQILKVEKAKQMNHDCDFTF